MLLLLLPPSPTMPIGTLDPGTRPRAVVSLRKDKAFFVVVGEHIGAQSVANALRPVNRRYVGHDAAWLMALRA